MYNPAKMLMQYLCRRRGLLLSPRDGGTSSRGSRAYKGTAGARGASITGARRQTCWRHNGLAEDVEVLLYNEICSMDEKYV